MKIECLRHPEATKESGFFFTQLRREYWLICEPAGKIATTTRACAAKLLHHFELWMNSLLASKMNNKAKRDALKLGGHPDDYDDELWVFGQSAKNLAEELMEHNEKTIKQALNWLVDYGYLYRRENPGVAFDRCYQYQINVALVQLKIDQVRQESLAKNAETRSGNHSSNGTTTVLLEPPSYQWDEHIKDLPYRSEIKELNSNTKKAATSSRTAQDQFESFDSPRGSKSNPTGKDVASSASAPEDVKNGTKQDSRSVAKKMSSSSTVEKISHEDECSAPPKNFEKVGNRVYEFTAKGQVKLPTDPGSQIARALACRSIQFWLYEQLAGEDFRLAVAPDNSVWGYEPYGDEWRPECDLLPIGKLASLAINHFGVLTIDDLNEVAIDRFETFQNWLKRTKLTTEQIHSKSVAHWLSLDLEAMDWDELGFEDDE